MPPFQHQQPMTGVIPRYLGPTAPKSCERDPNRPPVHTTPRASKR